MSGPSHREGEPERDAWLTEALRHAPDAGASPPPALSDAILRQARAAARATAPAAGSTSARPPNRWLAAWSWLARPPIAAGFASVMVATLAGLMWWGEPIDQTLERRPAAAAKEAAPVAPPPVVAAAKVDAPVAPRPPAAPEASLSTAAEPAQDAAAPRPVTKAAPAAPPPEAARRRDEARPETEAESKSVADSAPARSPTPAAAAAPRAAQGAQAFAPAGPASFDELLAAIGRQPERWTWQRSAGALPLTDNLQAWLQRLGAATATQWQADPRTPPAAKPLRLYRDGVLAATLVVGDEAVWLTPPAGLQTRAALAADAALTLERSLDLAAP